MTKSRGTLSLAQKIRNSLSAAGSAINPIYGTCGPRKEEASEQFSDDTDLDDWIDTLAEFDERAGD